MAYYVPLMSSKETLANSTNIVTQLREANTHKGKLEEQYNSADTLLACSRHLYVG